MIKILIVQAPRLSITGEVHDGVQQAWVTLPIVPAISTLIKFKSCDYGWVTGKVENVIYELTSDGELDYVELHCTLIA